MGQRPKPLWHRLCGRGIPANALALRSPTRTLRRTLPLFLAVRGFCRPVTRHLRQFSEGLATFFAPKKVKPRHNLLPEEVETLIDMREEQGALGTDEAALLRAVIDLDGLTVRDAMTPRWICCSCRMMRARWKP